MIVATPSRVDPAEADRIVLNNVPWEQYEQFLQLYEGMHRRLTYNAGVLEIMTVSQGHEENKAMLVRLIDVLTEELGLRVRSLGNTTWRRGTLRRGLEPDACWYIRSESRVRNKRPIDLDVDPPPDLVLEVEVSRSVLDRLEIYAALGISEVWRFTGAALRFCALQSDGQFRDVTHSLAFDKLTPDDLLHFIRQEGPIGETEVVKTFRTWVRSTYLSR